MSLFKDARVDELLKQYDKLQEQMISMASVIAKQEGVIASLEEKLQKVDEHIVELFNDTAAEVAKQWNDGLNQVINFSPYK